MKTQKKLKMITKVDLKKINGSGRTFKIGGCYVVDGYVVGCL